MNFEHLIEINDPNNPLIESLSRAQLWQGLVLRAEKPQEVMIGLDECRIVERGEDWLKRELRFGQWLVRDEVRLLPLDRVIYQVPASESTPARQLCMAIEEPAPEHLFVRFTYSDQVGQAEPAPSELEEFTAGHLKQAYIQSDRDTVTAIRRWADEGVLARALAAGKLN